MTDPAGQGPVELVTGGGRVLLLSMRRIADVVGYSAMYEFEDLVSELLGADRAAPRTPEPLELARRAYKLTRSVTRSGRVAELLRPRFGSAPVRGEYDLFLAVFNHPHELFNLHALSGWRERCRFAAVYICEAWEARLPEYLLELLQPFDHVFLGVDGAREAVARMVGRPCTYLPMGVDALRFAPPSVSAVRLIDVCGIGRRSPVTHGALMEMARREGLFYFYDTILRSGRDGAMTFRVIDAAEHRLLYSNLLKRSRYFIANRAWADQPELTRGKDEIAARFYEGAAAGTVMLGEPPDTDDFRNQFGWDDAVVPTPFHAPDIAETIHALDRDPARTERIRTAGVFHSLLRHDWSERLERIVQVAGLEPTQAMRARAERLRQTADAMRSAGAPSRQAR